MFKSSSVLAVLCGLGISAASAQVSSFDPATGLLTIPSVSVGAASYTRVTLRHLGNYVFALQDGTPQVPATPGVARFDPASGQLTVPAVTVGEATYLDLTLQADAGLNFTLQAATALPQATQDAVKAFMASYDAQWATAVPASGSARVAMLDNCYRGDGRTRAFISSDTDARLAEFKAREAYQIGRRSENLRVLALRQLTNPDGSTRQEIDIQVDVRFKDGSTDLGARNTLVSGSTAGTPGCSTPQAGTGLRFLGNQQLVQVAVRARNQRDQRHAIATGAAQNPAVNHRRAIQWQIVDPMGNATYAVVSGPGPASTVGGVATQFSLKFISPRLLRSAPELQGRNGNFLNWLDDDSWRFCRITGSNVPVATLADCAGQGATAMDWGWTTATPNAAADQGFADQGWVAGAVYRFDVYADEGWKTVNGQAGKTPLATYYASLDVLPYRFVDMAGSDGSDKFPRLNFGALSYAQVAANATSSSPAPLSVSWSLPQAMPDATPLALFQGWDFHQGAKTGNAGGAFNPAFRTITYNFPGSQASTNPAWVVTPRQPEQASKTYFEHTLLYTDRNSRQILSLVSFF